MKAKALCNSLVTVDLHSMQCKCVWQFHILMLNNVLYISQDLDLFYILYEMVGKDMLVTNRCCSVQFGH
jgi:hypothetical protein